MKASRVLLLGAVICFVLSVFGVGVGVNLIALGLAFFAGAMLVE